MVGARAGLTVAWEQNWEQAPEMVSIAFDPKVSRSSPDRYLTSGDTKA
jgi:hypothetical protein